MAQSRDVAELSSRVLQPLLHQAVQESLRELARSAHQAEPNGSSKSIECIVRGVASKVLEDHSESLKAFSATPESLRPSAPKPPETPLLQDASATPWMVWRQGIMQRQEPADLDAALPMHENFSELPPALDETAADEDSVPEDASRRSQQSSSSARPQAPSSCTEDELEEDLAARPPSRRGRATTAHSGVGSPTSSGTAWAARSDVGVADGSPILVQNGLTIEAKHSQHLMMRWKGRPRSALMVAKPGDPLVVATLQDVAAWIASQGIMVVLEPQLLADQPGLRQTVRSARTFSKADQLEKVIDLVITIGGDGTLTWAVSLFKGAMPPVLSFAAGSLGFLTPFPLNDWVRTLTGLLDMHRHQAPLPLTCRMRLQVRIRRRSGQSGSEVEERSLEVQCLNEVLVHRGNSGALAKLDVGVDGERVTLVQGDGLILATPTGSTAYSLAAGGSMVHPGVPAILLTPVSPHSLSFRPAVLPDSAVVTVGVPLTARNGAALSVDGKDICVLRLGDSVEVAMSPHPVPTICHSNETKDWFNSVHQGLQWNGRAEQKGP